MKLVKESLGQTFTRGNDDKLATIGVGKVAAAKAWYEKNKDFFTNVATFDDDNNFVIKKIGSIYNTIGIPSYVNVVFPRPMNELIVGISLKRSDWIEDALEKLVGARVPVPDVYLESSKKMADNGFINITTSTQYKNNHIFFYDSILNQIFSMGKWYAIVYGSIGYSGADLSTNNIHDYDGLVETILKYRNKKNIEKMKLVKESLGQTFTRGGEDKLKNLGLGKPVVIQKWFDDNLETLENGAILDDDFNLLIKNFNRIDKDKWRKMEIPSYINVKFVTSQIELKMGISMEREDWINEALDKMGRLPVPAEFEFISLKLEDQDFINITSKQQYKDGSIYFYDPLLGQIFSIDRKFCLNIYSKSGSSASNIFAKPTRNSAEVVDVLLNFRDKKLKRIMKENNAKIL